MNQVSTACKLLLIALGAGFAACSSAEPYDEDVASSENGVTTQWCRNNGGTYFPETGYCAYGRILKHWQESGGLPKFGYPISEERWGWVEGHYMPFQYFQRQRLEIQTGDIPGIPSGTITYGRVAANLCNGAWSSWCTEDYTSYPGARPIDVEEWTLGMSNDAGTARYAANECELMGPDAAQGRGHWVCGEVLRHYHANGGLAYFGYPFTDIVRYAQGTGCKQGDGQTWGDETCVAAEQLFERARIEVHPAFMSEGAGPQPGYIMLGLLTCEELGLVGQMAGC